MITINEEKRVFHLRTPHASYVMKIDDFGVLETHYFGASIGDDDLMRRAGKGGQVSMPEAKNRGDDFCQIPLEISSYGQGEYRVPSVAVCYENGSRVTDFRFKEYEIGAAKPDGGMPRCRDGKTLKITLEDKAEKIAAHLYYTVYDDVDAIVRSVVFENRSGKNVILDRAYSFNLDIKNFGYDMISLPGAHCRERWITRQGF